VRFTQGSGISKGESDSGRMTVLREGVLESMNHGDFILGGEGEEVFVVGRWIGKIP